MRISGLQKAGFSVGKTVAGLFRPPPPRCRDGVNSPYLPSCGFPATGDPRIIASHLSAVQCAAKLIEESLIRLSHGRLRKR